MGLQGNMEGKKKITDSHDLVTLIAFNVYLFYI